MQEVYIVGLKFNGKSGQGIAIYRKDEGNSGAIQGQFKAIQSNSLPKRQFTMNATYPSHRKSRAKRQFTRPGTPLL